MCFEPGEEGKDGKYEIARKYPGEEKEPGRTEAQPGRKQKKANRTEEGGGGEEMDK